VTHTKLTIFRPYIIFERVHFVDAVINLKQHVFWNSLQNMTPLAISSKTQVKSLAPATLPMSLYPYPQLLIYFPNKTSSTFLAVNVLKNLSNLSTSGGVERSCFARYSRTHNTYWDTLGGTRPQTNYNLSGACGNISVTRSS
jgi:hypothetical protein